MKSNNFTIVLCAVLSVFINLNTVFSQGCVAVRGMSCSGSNGGSASKAFLQKGEVQVGLGYRYFESYKHFKGDSEQKDRVENGTQVINNVHNLDLGITYGLTNRLSLSLNTPLSIYDRSSLYEHYGNALTTNPQQLRFHTDAKGLGDMRLSANYWIINPEKQSNGNLSIGLGIKAPTGNANVQGDFHKRNADGSDYVVTRAVDQSIQLGDGGWGASLEMQGFQSVGKRSSLYYNGFYLFNPRNVNTTLTRGTLTGSDPLIAYHSVADQFAGRLGINYLLLPKQNLTGSLGARIEGVPAHDAIGKSEGFRRPGYIVSLEPSLTYAKHNTLFVLSVPVAMYRNRTKSVYDLADPTGVRHGDAAFADYLVNLQVAYRFGKKTMAHPTLKMWQDATKPKEN